MRKLRILFFIIILHITNIFCLADIIRPEDLNAKSQENKSIDNIHLPDPAQISEPINNQEIIKTKIQEDTKSNEPNYKDINSDPKKPSKKLPSWSGSIMFDINIIKNLNQLLAGEKITADPTNINNGVSELAKTVFSLSSIIYKNPNDWVLWCNGQKFQPSYKKSEILFLELIEVNKNSAIFRWNAYENLDKIIPNWKDKLKLQDGFYNSPGNNIRYDYYNNALEFSLAVNQTFIVKDLEVVEGIKTK